MTKEKKYITHKGVFEGKTTKRMSIEPRNMSNIDDLIELFREKLPDDEEGTLKIYRRDRIKGDLTFIKKVMIFNNLFLNKEDSIKDKTIYSPSDKKKI